MRHQNKRQYQQRRKDSSYNQQQSGQKRYMDINCDIGQGYGIYQNNYEEEILPYVTSVNIACGGHAGDPVTMTKAIDMVKDHNINVGALIGYPDPLSNGQREMYMDVDELRAMVLYQLGALNAMLHSKGLEIRHVRTHGFLYRQLASDLLITETVAKAVAEFSKWITLIGLGGKILATACANANIKMGQEILIDRRYRKDGSMLPFTKIIDEKKYIEDAAMRAREFLQRGTITCEDKSKLRINAETIHIPSDRKESIELARTVWSMITEPRALHSDKYKSYFADLAELKN